jgi:hypothetical protein
MSPLSIGSNFGCKQASGGSSKEECGGRKQHFEIEEQPSSLSEYMCVVTELIRTMDWNMAAAIHDALCREAYL